MERTSSDKFPAQVNPVQQDKCKDDTRPWELSGSLMERDCPLFPEALVCDPQAKPQNDTHTCQENHGIEVKSLRPFKLNQSGKRPGAAAEGAGDPGQPAQTTDWPRQIIINHTAGQRACRKHPPKQEPNITRIFSIFDHTVNSPLLAKEGLGEVISGMLRKPPLTPPW